MIPSIEHEGSVGRKHIRAKIHGTIKNYSGKPLENAEILYVDRTYSVLGSGYSNADGEYYVQVDGKFRGMLNSTFAYGEKYLAYWFMDLYSDQSHKVEIILGNVEFIFFKQETISNSMISATLSVCCLLSSF